jgi:hypothetical protein
MLLLEDVRAVRKNGGLGHYELGVLVGQQAVRSTARVVGRLNGPWRTSGQSLTIFFLGPEIEA